MPAVRSARQSRFPAPPDKRGFAKRAIGFAKRALPVGKLPGFPFLWIACAAAAGLMIVTGGFNTGQLPVAHRAGFWLLLMGWNALKWQTLFALFVRKPTDWPRVALLGTIPLNLPLPLEIALCGRAVGVAMTAMPIDVWGRAVAISAVIFTVCSTAAWVLLRRTAKPVAAPADGLLIRARVAPDALAAIEAEDHYCRVHRRDGQSALVHYRFGDALKEVAELDGAQVHRGAWVAADAVTGARREGRRWHLTLPDGHAVPVSATHAAEARRRGWLRSR